RPYRRRLLLVGDVECPFGLSRWARQRFLRVDLRRHEERSKRTCKDGGGRVGSKRLADHGGVSSPGRILVLPATAGCCDEDNDVFASRKTRSGDRIVISATASYRCIRPNSAASDTLLGGNFRSRARSRRTWRRSRRSA